MVQVHIGSAPTNETPAQIGSSDYIARAMNECIAFKRMLERLQPVPAGVQAHYALRAFPHDFGSYYEVVVEADAGNAPAVEFAYAVERNTPERWDAVAQYELLWLERRDQYKRAVRAGELLASDVPEAYAKEHPPALPSDLRFAELMALFPL